jgi:ABC-type multidrug transport system fused ATPase/permease subunit
VVLNAAGVSPRTAARALWASAFRRRRPEGAVPYFASTRAPALTVCGLAVAEIVAVDLLLSGAVARLVALAVSLLLTLCLLGFLAALTAVPHLVTHSSVGLRYGATFALDLPADLVDDVAVRSHARHQKHTAEIADGVLWLPVTGTTNLVLSLRTPVSVRLGRDPEASVTQVRLSALDPQDAARQLSGRPAPAADGPATDGRGPRPDGVPTTADPDVPPVVRGLRWLGVIVLLTEIVLVATGWLDWRTAAAVLVVTETLLGLLGLLAGAVLLRQYRRGRSSGASRTAAAREALGFLLPPAVARFVRSELAAARIAYLAVRRRREGTRVGDVAIGYGRILRRTLVALALLVAALGGVLVTTSSGSTLRTVLGVACLYVGLLLLTFGLASKVRPHLVGDRRLAIRWGLDDEVCVGVEQLRSATLASGDDDLPAFRVPATGQGVIVLDLDGPVTVPTPRPGRTDLAHRLAVPVDDPGAALAVLNERLGRR